MHNVRNSYKTHTHTILSNTHAMQYKLGTCDGKKYFIMYVYVWFFAGFHSANSGDTLEPTQVVVRRRSCTHRGRYKHILYANRAHPRNVPTGHQSLKARSYGAVSYALKQHINTYGGGGGGGDRSSPTRDPVRKCQMPPNRLPAVASVVAVVFAATASLLCSAPGSAHAGFACLSSPCVHGVCVDQLNRQASHSIRYAYRYFCALVCFIISYHYVSML